MTAQYGARNLTLGSFAVISGISILEGMTSRPRRHDGAHVTEFRSSHSHRVVIYFPGLGMDAKTTFSHFMPHFENSTVMLVEYPHSGFKHEATFSLLVQMLRQHPGEELVLLGVSLGSSVALEFRRYLMTRSDTRETYQEVKFIFYSSVTGAADVNLQSKLIAAIGFMLRGGVISEQIWRAIARFREQNPNLKFPSVYAEAKYAELQEILSRIPIRLLASELRAVHFARRGRPGEFTNDSALILTYNVDHVVRQSAYKQLAAAFSKAEISEVLENGHADVRMAVSTEKFLSAIKRFLA